MQTYTETECKIIEAATKVFLERGRDGARMQEIAEQAGINKALLHYYFRSKDKLFALVVRLQIASIFDQLLSSVDPDAGFEIWLRGFISRYMKIISENPQLVSFILWEIQSGAEIVASLFSELAALDENGSNPLLKPIQVAIQNGEIRPADPVQLLISIIALCVYPYIARPILERIIPGLNISSQEFRLEREKAVFEQLWHGLEIK